MTRGVLILWCLLGWSCTLKAAEDTFIIKAFELEMAEYIADEQRYHLTVEELEQYPNRDIALNFAVTSGVNAYRGSKLLNNKNTKVVTMHDTLFVFEQNRLQSSLFYYYTDEALLKAEMATMSDASYSLTGEGFEYNLNQGTLIFERGGEGRWQEAD